MSSPPPIPGEAVQADRAPASDLIATLRDRFPGLALAVAAGQAAWPATKRLRTEYRDRTTYTIKIFGNDDLYDDLHAWVLTLLPRARQRALVVATSRRGGPYYPAPIAYHADGGTRPPAPSLRLRYDGAREQVITVTGHKIKVVVTDGAYGGDNQPWKPPQIVFTARSPAARDALLAEIGRILDHATQDQYRPAFRMLDKWDDWTRLDELAERTLDSVILPAGQLERIIADVERFLGAEQTYRRRCQPWHRCHLYEGPPGTGKTSVARAVAGHFGMDVWYLPLADVRRDGALLRTVAQIGPRSMLLLEDVDVFHAATARDEGAEQVTLSGLLNTLDGMATPHGLFTVLTTNTPDVIDPALLRPGRVDLTEHFGLAGPDEIRRIISRWYGQPADLPSGLEEIAPGEVTEACARHDDPAGAICALTAAALTRWPG